MRITRNSQQISLSRPRPAAILIQSPSVLIISPAFLINANLILSKDQVLTG
jgi:hypothetical protein